MSAKATFWAWKQKIDHCPTKLVLLYLADMCDEKDSCFPSVGTIAEHTGCCEKTVYNSLIKLEASGHIRKGHRYRKDGSWSSNLYTLNAGSIPVPTVSKPHIDDVEIGRNLLQGGTYRLPTGTVPLTDRVTYDVPSNTLLNSTLLNDPVGLTETPRKQDWEVIYEAYPKQVAKEDSKAPIVKALEQVGLDALLSHVRRYAAWCSAAEYNTRYIPNPANWFRGKRWEDTLPDPSSGNPQAKQARVAQLESIIKRSPAFPGGPRATELATKDEKEQYQKSKEELTKLVPGYDFSKLRH